MVYEIGNEDDKNLTAHVTVVHPGGWESSVEDVVDSKRREAIKSILRHLREQLGSEYENCDIAVTEVGKDRNSGQIRYATNIHPRTRSATEGLKSSTLMDESKRWTRDKAHDFMYPHATKIAKAFEEWIQARVEIIDADHEGVTVRSVAEGTRFRIQISPPGAGGLFVPAELVDKVDYFVKCTYDAATEAVRFLGYASRDEVKQHSPFSPDDSHVA